MNSIIKERLEKIEEGIVPEGYRKTKVGIIPEDWEVERLGECLDVRDGTHDSPRYVKEGIPFITSKNLVDGSIDWDNITYISEDDHKKFSQRSSVEDGDILFAMIGTIGNPLIVKKNFEFSIKNVALLKFANSDINNRYILGILKSDIISKQFSQKLNAGVQKFIGLNMIRSLETPIPPLQEQQQIANILSTWDKAIENIEKLIKEKEIQKKGIMQELLTGKTRLPGFDGEWEEVRLGDISGIKTGKLDANAMVEDGKYKFFTCAKEVYSIDKYAYDTEALLISGNGANVGYIHYYKGKFNAYQRTYILDEFVEDIWFIKYLLDLKLERRVFREKRSGNTPYITMSTLTEMILYVPPLPEQKAIAEILSTADKEIELLNELLEAKKEEKKGLMQLLLTGIVRV